MLTAGLIAGFGVTGPAHATEGKRVRITGEVMDTWCYLSGVMGGPEAVVGSAHHTCALWCAAGGIPVGVLTEDGTVYFVLVMEGSTDIVGTDTVLELQSDRITADGMAYERDGNNFLVVEKIVTNEGLTNHNHEDFGPIPGFAIPGLK
ncbi:MAG: hypothetical protein HQ481_03980 [Alphaproteobacteria bacterium]|nr:hypothetical protein [Alphaproteobacteria bacterium]